MPGGAGATRALAAANWAAHGRKKEAQGAGTRRRAWPAAAGRRCCRAGGRGRGARARPHGRLARGRAGVSARARLAPPGAKRRQLAPRQTIAARLASARPVRVRARAQPSRAQPSPAEPEPEPESHKPARPAGWPGQPAARLDARRLPGRLCAHTCARSLETKARPPACQRLRSAYGKPLARPAATFNPGRPADRSQPLERR